MQYTVREILNRLKDNRHSVTVFIHDRNACGIYDDNEFHLIPENLLNKRVTQRNIVKNKRIIHADLYV